MRSLSMLVLLVLVCSGCAGTTDNPPPPDSSPPIDAGDGPGFPDLGSDLPLVDLLVDQLVPDGSPDGPGADGPGVDGPGVNLCTAKTTDGIALNPGCDPDFQTNGPTTLGQFVNITTGAPAWLFTTGKKWWLFDTQARGGTGAFTAGGKDFATTLKGLKPDCAATGTDGTHLNPGCDLTFQANGPTSVGAVKNATTGNVSWFFSCGKKWWIYDPNAVGGGAFTGASGDIAAATALLPPGCASLAADGTPLNPGCDVSFQANGPTAWGEFTNPGNGQQAWLFVSGTKYWLYNPTTGAFTAAGGDLSASFKNLQPGCTATSPDGTPLNPGCDISIQANGPTAIGEFLNVGTGASSWLFTAGKKYWMFDPAASGGNGAFTAAGADIAAATRKLAP